MSRNIYEVVPSGGMWVLRQRGRKTTRTFATKDEAVERGREACRANRPSLLRVKRTPAAGESRE